MSHPWIYKLQLSSLRLISLHQGVPYSIFISIVTELFEQLNWASWIFQASKSTNDFLLDLQKLQGIWTSGTEASALNIQKWLPVFSAIRYAFCILFFLFFFFFDLEKGHVSRLKLRYFDLYLQLIKHPEMNFYTSDLQRL